MNRPAHARAAVNCETTKARMAPVYWRISTPYAVGAVIVDGDKVVGGAPIFRRWFGKRFDALPQGWRKERMAG